MALGVIVVGLISPQVAEALPDNFRNVDIFYVGAMPDRGDIEELRSLGIRHVVSLHRMPKRVARRARSASPNREKYSDARALLTSL